MQKKLIISTLVFLAGGAALGADTAREDLLKDGFVLSGVDGRLVVSGDSDRWFFQPDSDVSDSVGLVKAGTDMELLHSATLEKITTDAKRRSAEYYRLWGRVTRYQDRNFIFPIYFLPIGKIERPRSGTSQQPELPDSKLIINEPNDALIIPQEIVAKLRTRKIVRVEQLEKGMELKADSILADRTGFVIKQADDKMVFAVDAIGMNVQEISFPLLPCQALEKAQSAQSAEPDPLRFKISGILTRYKNENYLLLQRATPVYSHGNFGR